MTLAGKGAPNMIIVSEEWTPYSFMCQPMKAMTNKLDFCVDCNMTIEEIQG